MSSNIKCASITGSGALQNILTSVALDNESLHVVGIVATTPTDGTISVISIAAAVTSSKITVPVAAEGVTNISLPYRGVAMSGDITVSAAVSGAVTTVFYY